jgi:outer membrane protein assembly factor BamB
MPFWGPKHSKFQAPIEHGEVVQGAIAAFKVETRAAAAGKPAGVQLKPAWISRNMYQADPAIIANGLVFGYGSGADTTQATAELGLPYNTAVNRVANSSHATLYALDARTGEELWSSADEIKSFNHFSSLAVANGRVYIGTYDGKLYCFGVERNAAGTR